MMAAIFGTCWSVGRRMTLFNVATLCLLTAIAMNTKFSAILIGPMLLIALGLRALLPAPLDRPGRADFQHRRQSNRGNFAADHDRRDQLSGNLGLLRISIRCLERSIGPAEYGNESERAALLPLPGGNSRRLVSRRSISICLSRNGFKRSPAISVHSTAPSNKPKQRRCSPKFPATLERKFSRQFTALLSVSGKTIDILNQWLQKPSCIN